MNTSEHTMQRALPTASPLQPHLSASLVSSFSSSLDLDLHTALSSRRKAPPNTLMEYNTPPRVPQKTIQSLTSSQAAFILPQVVKASPILVPSSTRVPTPRPILSRISVTQDCIFPLPEPEEVP